MDNSELLDRAQFGKQVEYFWDSQVGGYLRARAQEVYTTAIQALKTCDPTDTRLIIKLQGDVWKAEEFEHWLSQAVTDGLKSLELLEGELDGE